MYFWILVPVFVSVCSLSLSQFHLCLRTFCLVYVSVLFVVSISVSVSDVSVSSVRVSEIEKGVRYGTIPFKIT